MHAVILSGGVGARLWPVSRDSHPKPFIKLADGESLLQKVYLRSAGIPTIQSITTVTNKDLLFKTKKEYVSSEKKCNGAFDCNYILEPFGRNTAAAIALAAQEIARLYGKDAIMLVLPSDHIVLDEPAFNQAVSQAELLALQGRIVTFGIKPSAPETGYGYIEADHHDVIRFIEKPNLEQAQIYLNNHYLWNSGMFCFSAQTMLDEMQTHCPEILAATQKCLALSTLLKNVGLYNLELDPESFAKVPEDSIDYAIMEKTQKAAVIACDMGWSDIGTWTAMHEITPSDTQGNSLKGEVVTHQVKNCYIESNDRVIGAIGIEDLVIIDTPDALLVAHQNNAQDVKTIYNQLKTMQHDVHKLHATVQRPWGSYTVLEETDHFKVKRLEVEPGASLSLQMHHHRAEHWVVISGQALIHNGNKTFILKINQSTSIPVGTQHRLTNSGKTKLIVLEVQTGSYLGEDDIIRFEDIYGRTIHITETAE